MLPSRLLVLPWLLAAGCSTGLAAERRAPPSTESLEADPELARFVATRGHRLGQPAHARATPDGSRVLYLESDARSDVQRLWRFDVATGKARLLVTAESLAGVPDRPPTPEEAAQRERMRLTARGLGSFELSRDGKLALVPFGGRIYLVDVETGRSRPLPRGQTADFDPRLSPDGRWVASVEAGDLFVRSATGGPPVQLTRGASPTLTHGLAEFVAEEEMDRFHGYWWSPDSSALAFEEADSSGVERYYLVDAAHPEVAPEGSPYPRPGKANVRVRLSVVSRTGGAPAWVEWDRARFPYLARVSWPEGGPLLLEVESRDQKELLLLAADPRSGRSRELVHEHDDAWIDLDDDLVWLPARRQLLWSSQRSGEDELELRDEHGALLRPLTTAAQGFRGVAWVNEREGAVVVEGGARSSEQSLWRIPLDGGPPKLLAGGPEFHSTTGRGPDAAASDAPLLVDHVERLDRPARTLLLSPESGGVLGELPDRAEPPEPPRAEIERIEIPGAILEAEVVLPRSFDPSRRYPVIDWVYGGPGFVTVRRSAESDQLQQWLADQGFVVVRIDNRGTPDRDRAFERVLAGSFARVPLGDQVAGLAALTRKRPYLDRSRVGIIGASFGGYLSALALLRRPDVFRAAVAIAPVVDWEDYDTHYTERYLGLPATNASGYRESSLLTGAESLSRPLMLAHGTADDNVHFAGTLKLVGALEAVGKAPEFLVIPGQTHLFADQATQRLLWARAAAFFLERLGVSGDAR